MATYSRHLPGGHVPLLATYSWRLPGGHVPYATGLHLATYSWLLPGGHVPAGTGRRTPGGCWEGTCHRWRRTPGGCRGGTCFPRLGDAPLAAAGRGSNWRRTLGGCQGGTCLPPPLFLASPAPPWVGSAGALGLSMRCVYSPGVGGCPFPPPSSPPLPFSGWVLPAPGAVLGRSALQPSGGRAAA